MPANIDTVVEFPRGRVARRAPTMPSTHSLVRTAQTGDGLDRCLVDVLLTLRLLARGQRTLAEAEADVTTTFTALRALARARRV